MIYFAAFFAGAAFFTADFGFAAFFAAAGFFAAGDFGFFGVVAFFALVGAAFFGDAAFFAPAGLAVVVFFGWTCLAFFVPFAALADFGVALERGLTALAICTFFGLGAEAGVAAVADVFTLAAVATFFAGLLPADLDRARFFVALAVVIEPEAAAFLGFVDFFLVAVGSVLAANLNEPLAPLPFVCLKCFALTPFFNANFKC